MNDYNVNKLISLVLFFSLLLISISYAGMDVKKNFCLKWKGIVIHHTAVETAQTTAEIRNYHIKHNGWVDIGYHFVIEKDGSVHTGRKLDKVGAHAKGRNSTHIGICVVGDNQFTAAQIRSLWELCRDLCTRFPIISIERHHEKCPGNSIPVEKIERMILK